MRESQAEEKKPSGKAESFPSLFFLFLQSLYRQRLIYVQNKGRLQKNHDRKVLEGIKWEETKNCNENMKASKTGEHGCRRHEQCSQDEQCA